MSGCAWANQIGAGGVPGYDSDLGAAYWVTSFLALPGAGLTIDGPFPNARYMSISAYNSLGASSGVHFYDAQIEPTTGANPFQPGVALGAAGSYEVQIVASPPPPQPAPNTLYVGQNNALVYVLYRIYDSDDAADPAGSVGLPEVSTTYRGQVTGTRGGCVVSTPAASVPPAAQVGAGEFAGAALQAPASGVGAPELAGAALPAPAADAWAVVAPSNLPNADASYAEAQVAPTPGRIVVVQARMPTFPDTNAGAPPWAPGEVRYWSLCDSGQYSLQVTGCVADHAALEDNGVATFVFSLPADQPTNATAAHGVNWLPLAPGGPDLLVYRQILAAPSFAQSIAAVLPGAALSMTMGSYAPSLALCSPDQFEDAGPAGCQPSSSPAGKGSTAQDSSSAKAGPVCRSATAHPSRLWPANHRLVRVTLSGATVAGGGALKYQITGVQQDEPVADPDRTEPDAKLGPAHNAVRLRAERRRRGHGRLYFIALKVTDRQGASCKRTLTVAVPLRRGQRPVIDTGRRYSSFARPAIHRRRR